MNFIGCTACIISLSLFYSFQTPNLLVLFLTTGFLIFDFGLLTIFFLIVSSQDWGDQIAHVRCLVLSLYGGFCFLILNFPINWLINFCNLHERCPISQSSSPYLYLKKFPELWWLMGKFILVIVFSIRIHLVAVFSTAVLSPYIWIKS